MTLIEVKGLLGVTAALGNQTGYNVTHIPTGRTVFNCGTLRKAGVALDKLAALGLDWDIKLARFCDPELEGPNDLREKVRPLFERLLKQGVVRTKSDSQVDKQMAG